MRYFEFKAFITIRAEDEPSAVVALARELSRVDDQVVHCIGIESVQPTEVDEEGVDIT